MTFQRKCSCTLKKLTKDFFLKMSFSKSFNFNFDWLPNNSFKSIMLWMKCPEIEIKDILTIWGVWSLFKIVYYWRKKALKKHKKWKEDQNQVLKLKSTYFYFFIIWHVWLFIFWRWYFPFNLIHFCWLSFLHFCFISLDFQLYSASINFHSFLPFYARTSL